MAEELALRLQEPLRAMGLEQGPVGDVEPELERLLGLGGCGAGPDPLLVLGGEPLVGLDPGAGDHGFVGPGRAAAPRARAPSPGPCAARWRRDRRSAAPRSGGGWSRRPGCRPRAPATPGRGSARASRRRSCRARPCRARPACCRASRQGPATSARARPWPRPRPWPARPARPRPACRRASPGRRPSSAPSRPAGRRARASACSSRPRTAGSSCGRSYSTRTWRIALPSCRRSKPSLISSRRRVPLISRSTGSRPRL